MMKTNKRIQRILCGLLLTCSLLSACAPGAEQNTADQPPAATHQTKNKTESRAESSESRSEDTSDSRTESAASGVTESVSTVSVGDESKAEESSSSLVSEEGVQRSMQRYETQAAEFERLEEYCREQFPKTFQNIVERQKRGLTIGSYHIIDVDGDGHLELLAGPSGYNDLEYINRKDREGIIIDSGSYLCRIEGDNVTKQFLINGVYNIGESYRFQIVPQKEDGKVVGVEGIQFVHYDQNGYIVQPGNSVEYYFDWVRPDGLERQASYVFKAYQAGESSLGFDYFDTTGGEETQYTEKEMQQLIKERHALLLTSSGYTIGPIDANGNNILSKRLGNYTDYLLYDSDTRLLTFEDLEAMLRRNHCTDDVSRKKYLELARNESAAIYGHIFGTEYMKDYFESKVWYIQDGSFDTYIENHDGHSQFNEIEQANIALIEAYEKALGLEDVSVS